MGQREESLDWELVAAQSNRIRTLAMKGEPEELDRLRLEAAVLQAMLAEVEHNHRVAAR